MKSPFGVGAAALLALMTPAFALAECKLAVLARLPITMEGLQPMVSAKINGVDVKLVADSGAFYSLIPQAIASQFKLSLRPPPGNFYLKGVGGRAEFSVARVKDFTIAGTTIHDLDFIVGGTAVIEGAAGVLGQNFFHIGDAEYDLAHGAIRLLRPSDCRKATLMYWAKDQPYSEMHIEESSAHDPMTRGTAYVNGREIRVMFDSGAATSILSLRAADRAGVKPDSSGVAAAGFNYGIGRGSVRTWIGPFASFKVGDEEIRNTRLRFGDIGLDSIDMLLGADFFLSHHIYVANSQRKLYFTYNGGPVFDLSVSPGAKEPTSASDSSLSAEALAQQGRVESARGDLSRALADLTRACELKPDEPSYFYDRGLTYLKLNQPPQALADFEQVVKLRPNDLETLMRLAQLHLAAQQKPEALASLDTVDRVAPREANLRLEIGLLYARMDRFERAIAQYDAWIAVHKVDVRMPTALSSRCFARAALGIELDKALDDCDAALRLSPKNGIVLETRGFVRLRQGKLDRAVSDFDASLKVRPGNAATLYGRGLARLHAGKISPGQADIAAATAIDSHIADELGKRGFTP